MSHHTATIRWQRTGPSFLKGQYSREHSWTFDGGITIAASPSPVNVPSPWSNAANVDPEEAFVAAIASCHMLTFLWLAAKEGYEIDSYEDQAIGTMTKNDQDVPWVSLVKLQPKIVYGGDKQPKAAEIDHLHHLAHEQCFIANSVKTEIVVESPP
jgi:organic hydroperoxide reductase OsmC/OhrA